MSEGFRNVPGVPEGWELVGIRKVRYMENYIWTSGYSSLWQDSEESDFVAPIIRKIEQPAKYRPFASADEFRPHRDRWTMHPNEPDKRFRPGDYNNDGVWGHDRRFYGYKNLFEGGALFDDGTPFGVRIDD